MITSKEVTYEDLFSGEPTKTVLYFNMTAQEIRTLLSTHPELNGISEKVKDGSQTPFEGWTFIAAIVEAAYGERTSDGRFIKNEGIRDVFRASPAYDALMEPMLDNPDLANAFLENLLPKKLVEESKILAESANVSTNDSHTYTGSDTMVQRRPTVPQDHLPPSNSSTVSPSTPSGDSE